MGSKEFGNSSWLGLCSCKKQKKNPNFLINNTSYLNLLLAFAVHNASLERAGALAINLILGIFLRIRLHRLVQSVGLRIGSWSNLEGTSNQERSRTGKTWSKLGLTGQIEMKPDTSSVESV